MAKHVIGVVANAPAENSIPVVQLERQIAQINEAVEVISRVVCLLISLLP